MIIANIFIWFLIMLLLLPESTVRISNRWFTWIYSRDYLISRLKKWNVQRIWYKPYVWITLRRWIKIKKWETEEDFYQTLNYAVGNVNKDINWINEKQYKRYEELFKKHYEGE